MSFDEAAAIPIGGLTAQAFLRKADLRSGERILVFGASGSVGTFAVQLAKSLGAHVTGICSGANAQLVTSLGADEVLDHTKEDFAARGRCCDVIFDAVWKANASHCKRALKKGGRFLSVSQSAELRDDDLQRIRELVEAGSLRAVIDRTYPLDEIVAAHRYVEAGHKRGNVVVKVTHG